MAHYDQNARESRNAAMMGLGGAVVWIAIVGAICYFWAVSSGKKKHEGGESPAAAAEAHAPG